MDDRTQAAIAAMTPLIAKNEGYAQCAPTAPEAIVRACLAARGVVVSPTDEEGE